MWLGFNALCVKIFILWGIALVYRWFMQGFFKNQMLNFTNRWYNFAVMVEN